MIHTLYEPFRHWSARGSVYLLSDLHFGDSACPLMDPRWPSPEAQLELINGIVQRSDTFVCLGDVGDARWAERIRAGRKVLLLGNHDRRSDCRGIFDEIYEGPLMIAEKILLSHEPVTGLRWCLNIHGHDHNQTEFYAEGCRHLNLAANVCGYVPVSLGKLIQGGVLAGIDSIHRITIDEATERKRKREQERF